MEPPVTTSCNGVDVCSMYQSPTIDGVHVRHSIEMEGVLPGRQISHLYIHGRGLAGMWCIGVLETCKVLIRRGLLTIERLHGYSFGALAVLLFICDIPITSALTLYYEVGIRSGCRRHTFCSVVSKMLHEILPPDAYRRCRDRVYIGYTVQFPYMAYHEKTYFQSNEELIRYVTYSMFIPGITAPLVGLLTNYIDGAIGNRLWGWCKQSVHSDTEDEADVRISEMFSPRTHTQELLVDKKETNHSQTETQSIQNRFQVELFPPWFCYSYIFHPSDPHIDLLIVRGSADMFRFLVGGRDGEHIKHRHSTH